MRHVPKSYLYDGRKFVQVPCVKLVRDEIGENAAKLTERRLEAFIKSTWVRCSVAQGER